jgi:phosphoribosylanthranilate isomerase
LAPENVKQAIQILRPWGIDVVSGVESASGKKDPARVLAFIRSAQEAAEEILATESK